MSQSAGKSWRAGAGALAMLPVLLALAGCGSDHDKEMADKLAAAQTAADRAVVAQHAAEKAAADAANAHHAAGAEPSVVSDSAAESDEGSDSGDNQGDDGGPAPSMGSGQTVSVDGTVNPGV